MKKVFLFLFFIQPFFIQAQTPKTNNRVIVVSGGGCRGAWGAGFANRLTDSFGIYNVAFGTSTGSLMNPLILLGDFKRLKEAYTTVTPEKIFNVNPFDKEGEVCLWNALVRVVLRKNTLGETDALHKLINDFLKDEDYTAIQAQHKFLAVGVTDLKNSEHKMKYSLPFNGEPAIDRAGEMKDWIWASCNQPILMTYYPSKKHPNRKEEGHFYVDGGLRQTVPLFEALHYAFADKKVKNIDVIINQPMLPQFKEKDDPKTILKSLKRTTDIWRTEVIDDDILVATQDTHCNDADTIHISLHYFPPAYFEENDLHFDAGEMTEMWNAGYRGEEDKPTLINFRQTEVTVCRRKIALYFEELNNYKKRFR